MDQSSKEDSPMVNGRAKPTGQRSQARADTAGGGGGSNRSPFIKRDRLKRNFLKSRMNSRRVVKKDDPELLEERERALLSSQTTSNSIDIKPNVKVKKEVSSNEEQFNEYPLRAVSKESLENMRTHLLKFQSKKRINPNESFHPPIRLHRKDTRNLQFQLTRAEIVQRQREIQEYKKKQLQPQQSQLQKASQTPNSVNTANQTPSVSATPAVVGSSTTNATPGLQTSAASATTDTTNQPPIVNGIVDGPTTTAPTAVASNGTEASTTAVPMITQLEEAGMAEDPTKVGMVKYDGKESELQEEATVDPFADVSPDGGGRAKRGNSRRKTRQLKVLDENAKKLRFEEFYPWVMEDYDGYNTWVGSYEAGNSDSYVLLSVEDDGSFTMIPADKVYKFTARNKYATLTIEEAEKRMDKKSGEVPRWLMKHLDNIGTTTTRYDRTKRRLKAVADQRNADEDEAHDDNSEVELDYDEEFADDEEAPIIDGNEQENKESEQRIKKEMLQANAMGLRDDEQLPDEEDADDLFNEKKIDEEGERIKKALQKTELAALYSSDDDEINPYLSESETENKEENEKIKKEDNENEGKEKLSRKSSPRKKSPSVTAPRLRVKSIKDCIIILKGSKKLLKNFPKGQWNPNVNKRKREESMGPETQIKEEPQANNASSISKSPLIKQEEPPSKKIKTEPTENGTIPLITEQDIIDAIGDGKVNVKEFGKGIRKKYPGPENKKLMFAIVKKLCRKVDNEHMELKK
ncbi:hypothetical protein NCAS_0A06850 [Naumovozyma castellii]|uniref:Transcription initiation factor IIF subunit alpha n=1 Tax=Naumovozyma castellii TaxID=27288 RepID=G0V6Z5_NAUCA|nr:hypothetical protein NCAS_0A06850 [Naumovozyma castellii CBS 4309]CCC67243.1 hypothetical protein NCAS_0A06850 [Naumovozyma castellii CBS 4309]